jgi:hypothetical protein
MIDSESLEWYTWFKLTGSLTTQKTCTMKQLVLSDAQRVVPAVFFPYAGTRTGGFGPDRARTMSRIPCKICRQPGQRHGLFRHHVKQFHESSCSVASVAGVVNTLLEIQGRLPVQDLSPSRICWIPGGRGPLERDGWGRRVTGGGGGFPLPVLGQVVEASSGRL